MAVYMGPCNYGTPEPGERYITADSGQPPSSTISVKGDLDMKQSRIFNLQDPREDEPSDATTVGYVGRLASYIFNEKLGYDGGIMTGNLNMGGHKLIIANPEDNQDAVNKQYLDDKLQQKLGYDGGIMTGSLDMGGHKLIIANPEDDQDAVNKQYLYTILQQIKPFSLARYIVFPHADGTKSYFGVGTKRNIELDRDKVFELFHDNTHNPQNFVSGPIRPTLHPLKDDAIMHLDQLNINTASLSKPWTFIFSSKYDNMNKEPNYILINFGVSGIDRILITSTHVFSYAIGGQEVVEIDIDTSTLNHFTFEYANDKLVVWINGASRKTHNILLNNIVDIRFGINYLGIVSL